MRPHHTEYLCKLYSILKTTKVNAQLNVYQNTHLQGINKRQIVESDIIIVVLDVTECLLVVLHQRVDLTVLSLQ